VSGDLRQSLGCEIRQRRCRLGVSQEALAARCGVHRTYMGALERGERNVSLEIISKVSDGLGISVSELFFAAEERLSDVKSPNPVNRKQDTETTIVNRAQN
jgi:transcriptional regulator with XRE-family HTH domain